jgi:hypothetical protein
MTTNNSKPDKTTGKFSEFEKAFGENFVEAIDPDNWTIGEDLSAAYERLEKEVAKALVDEDRYRKQVRENIFGRIGESSDLPNAGVFKVHPAHLEKVQRGLLFNGGVEACDGINAVHDTLPLTITQIGVCLVSYNGQQGAWAHRLFRKDLREKLSDPIDEVVQILERREKREGASQPGNEMSQLARRGIMAYAERAILARKSTAAWRMGHGSPAPYELLTGLWSSQGDRIKMSLDLIQWYVDYERFVFIPSAPRKRHLLTIGNALDPMEFVILHSLESDIREMINRGGYRNESGVLPLMKDFCREVAPKIAIGLFRVWEGAPPYMFYAHVDHAEMAAHIAMADSVLQEHRGFPMLIDLADTVCKTTFGVDSFSASVQLAYTDAGQPFRYLGERETRN